MVDVPILLGGGAITDAAHAARLGADAWAARAPEVIDVIEAIARGRDLPPASVPA
jgi:methanogenic corrinoid protein MtbC1